MPLMKWNGSDWNEMAVSGIKWQLLESNGSAWNQMAVTAGLHDNLRFCNFAARSSEIADSATIPR